MPTIALDLGCGSRPVNVFNADVVYGIDIRDDLAQNIIRRDLAVEKLPFEDNYFDFISACDVLEHIPRVIYAPQRKNSFIDLMSEIWRTLKPGGKFLSMTPAFPRAEAFRDPTHVNIITEETFPLYFDDTNTWANMYGFIGAFIIESQQWNGCHLISTLVKTMPKPQS